MRTATFVLLAGLIPSALPAQSGTLQLDSDGNYTPSLYRGVSSSAGPDAPGDLLRLFSPSNATALSGYAPITDEILPLFDPGQWANLSGGNAEMYAYAFSGSLFHTFAVTDVNDSWPGYDGSRNTIICTNAFDDTISGYDRNGVPLFRVATPTPGPVGSAYDSLRDWYWYCDWTTNELIALDANRLHNGVATVVDSFSTATEITRIAGVAFNCLDDTLVSGGRDQGQQVAYAISTKAVVATWATLGGSVNDPQGCGLSAESGIATTDFQDSTTRIHEGTAGIRPGLMAIEVAANTVRAFCTKFGPNADNAVVFGWANSPGRAILKGVQTCLSRQATKAGVANIIGTKGERVFPVSGGPIYVQAATLPSLQVSGLVVLP